MAQIINGKDKKIIVNQINELYKQNARSGIYEDGYEYFYTCPDPKIYPHQWFWDSCFHIIVNAKLGNFDAAIAELDSLLHFQSANGFIGHMIYWKKQFSLIDSVLHHWYPEAEMSPFIQPAYLAHALNSLYNGLKTHSVENSEKAKEVLKKYYTPIKKYYDCIFNERVLYPDRPLISIIHPWESGTDNIPKYDRVLGISGSLMSLKWGYQLIKVLRVNSICDWDYEKIKNRDCFVVEDVLVNSVYIDGLWILADLAEKLGIDNKGLMERAEMMEKAMITEMYNKEDKIFYDTYGKNHIQSQTKTVSSFAAFNLRIINKEVIEEMIKNHLLNNHEFNTSYPIPSVAKDHDQYNPKNSVTLWRGPTWIATNWYIVKGLKRHQENNNLITNTLEKVKNSSIKLIRKSGLREYYNPETGQGYGAEGFGWSALIIDFL
ncbi:MAG: hypothetical protein GF364_08340 [Candidatus Lokiarchaeota archaeon]|nr:hypothetical protein [Candidatus Lokiarchaeota archaeon]